MEKKLETASDSLKAEQAKSKQEQKREYRRRYHEKNKAWENEKNRLRYHERYKKDAAWTKKRKASWAKYVAKQPKEWHRARYRKYKKPYLQLSESTRSKIREACKKWTKENWEKRVEYARHYRRKNPVFGFKGKIAAARKSGDIRKLAEECLNAIIRLDAEGGSGRSKSENRAGSVRLRNGDSPNAKTKPGNQKVAVNARKDTA